MDLGLPELTDEQIEQVSKIAEKAARKHVFSQVSPKQVEKLNVSVEAEGNKPISFSIEIDLALMPCAKSTVEKTLADEAVKEAFQAIETYLRKLK